MQPLFTDSEFSPIAFLSFSVVIFLTCFTTIVFIVFIRITLIRCLNSSLKIILQFSFFSLWMFCYVVICLYVDVLLRSDMSFNLLSTIFHLFTWYSYLSVKSHKLAFMQDDYLFIIILDTIIADIPSTNSGLLFMPSKIQRSGREFYIPCLTCL